MRVSSSIAGGLPGGGGNVELSNRVVKPAQAVDLSTPAAISMERLTLAKLRSTLFFRGSSRGGISAISLA